MRKRIGYVLMAIAVLHEVVGLIAYSPVLLEILQAGFFNTINPPYWERDAAFWFLMFGAVLFLLGWVAQWSLDTARYIPPFIGWGILLVCIVGVTMMPASGFWLAIPVAFIMVRSGQQQFSDAQSQPV